MAKATKQQQISVTCSVCGKVIEPRQGWPIPVDYVWKDGTNICMDCIRTSLSNKQGGVSK